MKNSNLAKIKGLLKGVVAGAALLGVLAACGNKNDNTTPINAFTQSCVNCENITGFPFFSAQTQAYSMNYSSWSGTSALTLAWSFSGQNTNTQNSGQNYNQWASPAMNYAGQVSAAGTANVTTALNLGFCPQLPPGRYNLTTQTVGQWNQGQISGLKMLLTGPVTAVAVVNQAQASEYSYGGGWFGGGGTATSRVNGYLVIEQVNGYYCQGAQLTMY